MEGMRLDVIAVVGAGGETIPNENSGRPRGAEPVVAVFR